MSYKFKQEGDYIRRRCPKCMRQYEIVVDAHNIRDIKALRDCDQEVEKCPPAAAAKEFQQAVHRN